MYIFDISLGPRRQEMFLNISDAFGNYTVYLKTLLGLAYTLPEFFDPFLTCFALKTTKYMQFVSI